MTDRGVYVSALELFSLGIGPSSSHTVGPMRAGAMFRERLAAASDLERVTRFVVRLQGSLAATGIGHGSPDAVIAGLRGLQPETVDPDLVHGEWDRLDAGETIDVDGVSMAKDDIVFAPFSRHDGHPNSLVLTAGSDGETLLSETYLSIGGGFIERVGDPEADAANGDEANTTTASDDDPASPQLRHRYASIAELMEVVGERRIADIAWEDEVALHGEEKARAGLDLIWSEMRSCIERGLEGQGVLPGRLGVKRRAAEGLRKLRERDGCDTAEEALALYALAVNEENAAGRRVVTAPTNGAAGVLPAVLYFATVQGGFDPEAIRTFLLTATAIGSVFKANASISGAEAGCQAEVGSACAMAAAGITAIRGGSVAQIENAAEIALEHHLGLTCDPVGGLVQIPCIERNAVAASTALTACRLALLGDGTHVVPLDTTIETMRQTGADMSERYKETSTGGLAVNVVEC